MQRIVILGNAGSGKSTLARAMGKRLGVPVVHLDTLFWEPGWVEPDAEQFRQRVGEAIAGDSWVCEGTTPGAHSTCACPEPTWSSGSIRPGLPVSPG